MKSSYTLALLAALCMLIVPSYAQTGAQEGNGLGNAYIKASQAMIGGSLVVELGDPNIPNGLSVLSWSDGFCTHVYPGLGPVALDIFSPAYAILALPLDATGKAILSGPIPNDPALVMAPAFYANSLVFDLSLPAPSASMSKTVRIGFESMDSYTPTADMGAPRAMHRATSLARDDADNQFKILVTGGGGDNVLIPTPSETTEIYNPLDRTFSPGPAMSVQRAYHRATLLPNGQILVSGGVASGGVVTADCELYDPTTNTFIPTGAMNFPRLGHGATLLANGKVFVSGGLSTYVNANSNLVAAMNSSQAHGEIFDPATGSWSMVPGVMSSKRAGHTHTLLPNGDVLIAGGMNGGTTSSAWLTNNQVPTVTATCNLYDPTTNSFTVTGGMSVARAFHGASVISNGEVLVTGGFTVDTFNGTVTPTANCTRYNGSVWANTGPLLAGVAFHTQVTSEVNGDAIISGGWTGQFGNGHAAVNGAGRHDGVSFVQMNDIGFHPTLTSSLSNVGHHAFVKVSPGQYLVMGGSNTTESQQSGYVYHE